MEITTGIIDDHGVPRVGLRVQTGEHDQECVTYAMNAELARKVAFSLMQEADELDPPMWREP